MKKDIHPKYQEVVVKCACGNEFKTRSTKNEISLSLCNACHPFFTGKQKFVDTAGRIEKFQKRFNLMEGTGTATVIKEQKKVSKKQVQSAAIQEEKRLKAAKRIPKRADGPVEGKDAKKSEGGEAPATEA